MLVIVDSANKRRNVLLSTIHRPGWQFMEASLDGPSKRWQDGTENPPPSYPCHAVGITVLGPYPGFAGEGTLWIDDVALVRPRCRRFQAWRWKCRVHGSEMSTASAKRLNFAPVEKGIAFAGNWRISGESSCPRRRAGYRDNGAVCLETAGLLRLHPASDDGGADQGDTTLLRSGSAGWCGIRAVGFSRHERTLRLFRLR